MEKVRLEDVVKKTITGEWGTEIKNDINDIYVIRTADFNNDGTINYENILKRNIKKDKINEKKLEIGDIIVEKSGGTDKNPVGRVVFFNKKDYLCLANNFTQVIRIKENINSKYIFYNLLYLYKKGNTLKMFNKTTGIQNLQMKQFLIQNINLVSLNEQNKIVNKLDKVQEIIDFRKKQIEELDELIKLQFIEMFGDPNIVKNDEKIELKKIMINANNGMARRGNDSDGNIVLRLVELQRNYINYANVNRIILKDNEKKKYLLSQGDILFARVNGNPDNVGRCAYFKDIGENVYYNDHIIRVKFDLGKINPIYLCILLNDEYGKSEFKNKIKTSAGQYTISQDGIGKVKILLPPIELQNKFADFVNQINKQKIILEKSLKETEELQDSLMNKYFGE